MTPAEVKFGIHQQLAARGHGATIVGIHSIFIEDGVCHVGYDVEPIGDTLFVEFPLPPGLSRDGLKEFVWWLADDSAGETKH